MNLAGEDHNFHVHQVRFRVVSAAELDQTRVPNHIFAKGVLMDSVPLTHADRICSSVADWRKGACKAHPATVDILETIATLGHARAPASQQIAAAVGLEPQDFRHWLHRMEQAKLSDVEAEPAPPEEQEEVAQANPHIFRGLV